MKECVPYSRERRGRGVKIYRSEKQRVRIYASKRISQMSSTIYLGGAESSPLINKNFKKMCMKCFLNLYALIDEKCF